MQVFPILFKTTSSGRKQSWQIFVRNNSYWTETAMVGGKLIKSSPTLCEGKNIGRANSTNEFEQAFCEASAKWRKKKEEGFAELGETPKSYFKPMLALKYSDFKDELGFPCFCQPKLNGIRCILKQDGMWTRKGKPIVSCPHIFRQAKPLLEKHPYVILDGELYNHELKSDFEQITSLVRKTKPTPADLKETEAIIQYHVYDLPSYDKRFGRRSLMLAYLIKETGILPSIVTVDTIRVSNGKCLHQFHLDCLKKGYEGSMVRVDDFYQMDKRSPFLLKRKEFQDAEFPIVDICEGKGNRAGMAGYMVLRLPNGDTFHSNIKSKHSKLKFLLENRKRFIGKKATCKFFQKTAKGVPLFPFVIDIDRKDL